MEKFKLKKKNQASKIAAFSLLTMGAIQLTEIPKTNSLFIDDKDTALIYMANLQNLKKNIIISKVDVGYTYVNVSMNFNRNTVAGPKDTDVYTIKTPDACTIESVEVSTAPDAPNSIDRANKTITYNTYDENKQYNHSVQLKCLVYTDNEFKKTTDIIKDGNLQIPITVTEQITTTKPNGITVTEEEFTFGEDTYVFKDYLNNYPTPKPGGNTTTIDAITNEAKYKQLILWLNKHIENNIYVGDYYSNEEEANIISNSWTTKYLSSKYPTYEDILKEISSDTTKSTEILPGLVVEQNCDSNNVCTENYFVEEQYYGGLATYVITRKDQSWLNLFFTTTNKEKFNDSFKFYLFNYIDAVEINNKEMNIPFLLLNYIQSVTEEGISAIIENPTIFGVTRVNYNENSTTLPGAGQLRLISQRLIPKIAELMTPSALNIFYNNQEYMLGAFKEGLELVASELKYNDGTVISKAVIDDILADEAIASAIARNSFDDPEAKEFVESFVKYDKESNKFLKVEIKSDIANRKNIVTINEVDESMNNIFNNLSDLEKENVAMNFGKNEDESIAVKLSYKNELAVYDINTAFIDINKIIKLIDENINDILKSLSYMVSDDTMTISYKKGEVSRQEENGVTYINYTFEKVVEDHLDEVEDKPLVPIDKEENQEEKEESVEIKSDEVIVEKEPTAEETTDKLVEEKKPEKQEEISKEEIVPTEPLGEKTEDDKIISEETTIPNEEITKVLDSPRKRIELTRAEE